ncbi:MAG: hypothetical protein K8T89_18315 [Planctomycetes bacterium]|nr:hypothetical protein [Planctomycetota bacterium]
MLSRRKCIILLSLIACFAAVIGIAIYPSKADREHRPQFGTDESQCVWNTYVGKTSEELIAELGEPTRQSPWKIGFPRSEVFEKYKGLRTLEWHWPSGQFLALVYPIDGKWVCYQSCWVPKHIILD